MKLLTVSFGSVLAFILLFSTTNVSAQEIYVGATVKNGDTLLVEHLPTAQVTAYRNRKYRNTWKYKKTVQRVKKVYPYATLGAELYENYLEQSADFETKKERRKFLKTEEKKLKSKFEGKIRDVTIKEGIILVKLIDRQTNYTSYEILQELKGNTSAFLWQGVARLFDSSLKHQYDPLGDDWMIEEIIGRINAGEI